MQKIRNLHDLDRIMRLVIGITCLYVGFIDQSLIVNRVVAVLVGLFGAANFYAFFTSRCAVYTVAGFSTYSEPKQKVEE